MSGRYKAYGEYKDSGVEWLGEIPEYWHINKMRYMFSFGKGLTITKENLMDEGIPCVNYGEVHSKFGFEVDPGKHFLKCVNSQYLITSPNSFLNKGDLVFADTSEDIEGSGNFTHLISDDALFAGYHTIIARPHESKNSRFYAYLFDCSQLRSQIKYSVKGVKVFSITQAILRAINIWLPSPEEQTQIAAFLDHETAKIDTLIDKQQQLIELLKEKRQAVISHAVTKGLDPDVPMKDSGVDWLGEVPEHWIVSRIGYYASKIGSGKTPKGGAEIYQSSGILFLRSQNIYDDGLRISDSDNAYISEVIHEEMNNTKVKVGDVLLNITGGSIGRSCIVTNELIEANVNQHVCILRFADLYREFISLFMKSKSFKKQIDIFQTGGNREGLNFWQISKFIFCVPIYSEINAIVEFIKGKIILFNELEEKSILAIELLKERRTALISAAVTGKIDVRDWQVPVTQTESDEVMA